MVFKIKINYVWYKITKKILPAYEKKNGLDLTYLDIF